mmetsp:Transcript_25360/g.59428  ORF Transcript_25360/g.59428 Transcript_25360/m.59428 type:complete len:82 (+) Transcript_25360:3452-3697(+)
MRCCAAVVVVIVSLPPKMSVAVVADGAVVVQTKSASNNLVKDKGDDNGTIMKFPSVLFSTSQLFLLCVDSIRGSSNGENEQ